MMNMLPLFLRSVPPGLSVASVLPELILCRERSIGGKHKQVTDTLRLALFCLSARTSFPLREKKSSISS
jgi:hypothetical protein